MNKRTEQKKKVLTKKHWKELVGSSCFSSGRLAFWFAVLILLEKGVKTRAQALKVLNKLNIGLSSFDAEAAVAIALNTRRPDWLKVEKQQEV